MFCVTTVRRWRAGECFLTPHTFPLTKGASSACGCKRSAQLEAGRRLDGVQQLAPHGVLVTELGELEQVHAGAGGGETLKVAAAVVNAEGRVQLLSEGVKALISHL